MADCVFPSLSPWMGEGASRSTDLAAEERRQTGVSAQTVFLPSDAGADPPTGRKG